MRRRDFILLVGGVAAGWSFPANAQQDAKPVIGFLSGRSLSSDAHLVQAFRNGLNESGYVEGRNVVIEFRWAEGESEQLTKFGVELARHAAVVFLGAIDTRIHELQKALAAVPAVY